MYLLKYFRKLYSVFLYIKITLYYIEEKKLRRKQQNLLKNKTTCFPLTPL